jgi:hypothetical protein
VGTLCHLLPPLTRCAAWPQAGEIAGSIPGDVLPGRVLLRGGSGGDLDLAPFLTGPARFPSLPPRIAKGIAAGTTSSTLQVGMQAGGGAHVSRSGGRSSAC